VKIRRITAIPVRLRMRRPVTLASGVVSAADNVIARLETADGIVGWGEAASAPTMTGETVASMVRAIEELAPRLTDTEDAHAAMHAMPGNQGAKAAIDIALHDAMGKASAKPVYELLGGAKRQSVALLWTLAADDIAQAREKRAEGYRAFKIKVGIDAPEADAERTIALCRELQGVELICADANQGWTVEEAIRYVRAVEGHGVAFLEQPVAAGDIDGMARVAAVGHMAIAFDEGIHDLADIRRHHEARAAAGGSLKAIKLGGLRGLLAGAELCGSLGMRVNLACKIAESGIAAAALLHAALAVPALDWAVSLTSHHLVDDTIATSLPITGGRAAAPTGAGLGIEVRERDLERYRLT
jgi:L-alanine-DL-glutamate epimerase-like enolase superfamily enzyme